MNRLCATSLACLLGLAAPASHARATRECNTNFDYEVVVDAQEAGRRELLAIVADPARNPAAYERLWEPRSARETLFDWFPNKVILGYERVQDTAEIARSIAADPLLASLGVQHVAPSSQACFAVPLPAVPIEVTEYYNRLLGHYFLSGSSAESAIIDSGGAGEGWERSGEKFAAVAPGLCGGDRPVFRFYGPGPNSHFFTVDTVECGTVRRTDSGWQYEGEAFGAQPPQNGACPGRTRPLYRLYNNRASRGDSNHRYVSRLDLYAEMRVQGWIGEGIAMCLTDSGR
jgi:hypothetical protein